MEIEIEKSRDGHLPNYLDIDKQLLNFWIRKDEIRQLILLVISVYDELLVN